MSKSRVLSAFLDKTVRDINLEVLKTCKSTKKLNGTIYLDTGAITFLLYQNSFIIGHHTFIKELHVDVINEKLRIQFNHEVEASLTFKEIKDKNDFFNYMVLNDNPFTFDDIEKIRDIISVLIDRFYAAWWK